LHFDMEWQAAGSDPIERDTTGRLAIWLDDTCLTRHEDIWSKTVRNDVLVSAYPLAMWLAGSWWRLLHEPFPQNAHTDWLLAHGMGSANQGYVWPNIVLASDDEQVLIWATAEREQNQSVQYLEGLTTPEAVSLQTFAQGAEQFIGNVISRLSAMGHDATDLA